MRDKAGGRFPFAAVGLLLIALSAAPTFIGMVRGFNQLQRGEAATAVNAGVKLAYHPMFVACGAIGVLLVIVGIARAGRRRE